MKNRIRVGQIRRGHWGFEVLTWETGSLNFLPIREIRQRLKPCNLTRSSESEIAQFKRSPVTKSRARENRQRKTFDFSTSSEYWNDPSSLRWEGNTACTSVATKWTMNPLCDLIVVGFIVVMVLLNIYFSKVQSETPMTYVSGLPKKRPASPPIEQRTLVGPPSAVHLSIH